MSIIKKIKVFSSDDRGEIIDIFTHEPKDHCTIVTFTKDAIRGNHFHKESIQSAYVMEGNFQIFNVMIDQDLKYDSKKIEIIETTKGDYITHEKFEAHSYKCTSDSGSLMVFTKGVRGGKFYEDDTYRIEKKLI
jgi:dTDP-4-dehydrorhamnose 3,5-epimerase-like enzyme|tara:strand:+ start:12 stop:413 length:402 start_codon:yes stop_codon:yes gene_type:complete